MPDSDKRSLITEKRRIFQTGGSIAIILPKEWLEKHNLKPGDEVGVVADAILKVIPMQEID